MRAAIIGCGNIGCGYTDLVRPPGIFSHAHAYVEHPGIELVAVSDPDPAKARAAAERWGVAEVFADHREMLAQAKPDLVSICSPNDTHVAIGLGVLGAASVRGLICEKPLALDTADGRKLDAAAVAAGKPLLVNYSRRFDRAYQELGSRLRAGSLGAVQAVTGFYGKGLIHNGTHWLDMVRFLFGEPEWVMGADSEFAFGEDQTYSLTLGLAAGLSATSEATDHEALTVFDMHIASTTGRVHLTDGGRTINFYDPVPSATPRMSVAALADALPMAVANLVDCVEGRAQPLCSGVDGVAALALAEAVRASALSGERVLLERPMR